VNLEAIRTEFEEEQTWRQEEIRFLRNQIENIVDLSEKMLFRRALVVMLYAHYEGFCKFALLQYVKAINRAAIKCEEASFAIVAGAWAKIFLELEMGNQKSSIFRSKLPDDSRLHRFSRRRNFVEQMAEFRGLVAQIPEDTVDTESNLWPIVMQKNLYVLGLEHTLFSEHDNTIQQLVNRRNNIAHGTDRNGFTAEQYEKLESAVFRIMDDLMQVVINAIGEERYKHRH
jgi:hypothetical protein